MPGNLTTSISGGYAPPCSGPVVDRDVDDSHVERFRKIIRHGSGISHCPRRRRNSPEWRYWNVGGSTCCERPRRINFMLRCGGLRRFAVSLLIARPSSWSMTHCKTSGRLRTCTMSTPSPDRPQCRGTAAYVFIAEKSHCMDFRALIVGGSIMKTISTSFPAAISNRAVSNATIPPMQ